MTDPDSSMLMYIGLLVLLIIIHGFFTMSEIALISLNDNKVRKMAGENHKKAKIVVKLIENPSKFLATIQVGVTFSGFLAAAIAADNFADRIVYAMRNIAVNRELVHVVSLIAITLLIAFFCLVLGELVPKRIAMQNYEKIAFAVAGPLKAMSVLNKPFVFIISIATNGVLRLIGIDPSHKPEEVTEEEIRMMVDVGNEIGNIEQLEKEMINNVFELDDRTAKDIMTHRTKIMAVELETPLEEIIEVARETGYSRIPVYEEDIDSIVGILYVKDLLGLVLQQKSSHNFDIRKYMRKPMYVIASTECTRLFARFQDEKTQMAVVVDEYGGTAGMVTMEDLVESIVGNIQDEYDNEEEDVIPVEPNVYRVSGVADIEDVAKFFDLALSEEDIDEFDTIGGYLLSKVGEIPGEGECPFTKIGNVLFTVEEMDERRVVKIRAERITAQLENALEENAEIPSVERA